MSKDTDENQPVDESLEDAISGLLDAADKNEDEPIKAEEPEESKESKDDPVEEEAAETEDDADEEEAPETEEVEETEELTASGDVEEQVVEEDGLDAPEHWEAQHREIFNGQTKEAKEWLLERHKSMEGEFTRKSQEIADTKRQYDAVRDALAPYEQEFASAGLDHAGAVRKLASVHQALKTDGRSAIMDLAQTYGIDLSEPELDESTDPALRQIQQQMNQIQSGLSRQEQVAQQSQADALQSTIQQFEAAKDADGQLLHPHFLTLKDDITRLFNAGMAMDLEEGYVKALSLRPELKPAEAPKPKVVTKADQAERVKKAKKAATGIRSSGAVGKQSKELSLHDEIASLMN